MDCRGDFFYVKETIALPYWSTQLQNASQMNSVHLLIG